MLIICYNEITDRWNITDDFAVAQIKSENGFTGEYEKIKT